MSGSIEGIVRQYAEGADALYRLRTSMVEAPHVRLNQLCRIDERLAAHLDGLEVAGVGGERAALELMAAPGDGAFFVCACMAIVKRRFDQIDRMVRILGAGSEGLDGLILAFGWVPPRKLEGLVASLLHDPDPLRQRIGLDSCRLHRVDPGRALEAALRSESVEVMLSGLRLLGSIGRASLVDHCLDLAQHENIAIRREAAIAAVLLGDRVHAVPFLRDVVNAGPCPAASRWLLRLEPRAADKTRPKSVTVNGTREAIKFIGLSGDATEVPFLIDCMADERLARAAGESFCLLTGVDLAMDRLERKPPNRMMALSADDLVNDPAAHADADLAWPCPERVGLWWQEHMASFAGGRIQFMGREPEPAHCIFVLNNGSQPQRILAAEWLCFLRPGTSTFNVATPAWRQQQLLSILQ